MYVYKYIYIMMINKYILLNIYSMENTILPPKVAE